MVAIFCSTPYQLIIACQLRNTIYKEKIVHLYILNHFKNSDIVYENIKNQFFFNEVIFSDCVNFTKSISEKTIKRYLQKIIHFYNYKKLAHKYFKIQNQKYDSVLFSYPDIVIQIAVKKIFKNNNNLRVRMFEDGSGGYSNRIRKTTGLKKIFNFFSGSSIVDDYTEIWAFQPSLIKNPNIEVKKIPSVNREDLEFKNLINRIFDCGQIEIKERIVFFEQPFNFDKLLNSIIKKLLTFNYVIKLHPRTSNKDFENYNLFPSNNIPWEVIALNNKTEEKVLISFYSTALITGKIMFDEEPIIIFLYNLSELRGVYDIGDDHREFINNLKKTYRDPSRIMIPNELEEITKFLSGNN